MYFLFRFHCERRCRRSLVPNKKKCCPVISVLESRSPIFLSVSGWSAESRASLWVGRTWTGNRRSDIPRGHLPQKRSSSPGASVTSQLPSPPPLIHAHIFPHPDCLFTFLLFLPLRLASSAFSMYLRKIKRSPVHNGSQESLLDTSAPFVNPSAEYLQSMSDAISTQLSRNVVREVEFLQQGATDSDHHNGNCLSSFATDSSMVISSLVNLSCNGHCEPPLPRQGSDDISRSCKNDVELSLLAIVFEALRRSGLACQGSANMIQMEIGHPTNVRHVAHVTFDRFNGFLGLPAEFQLEIPRIVPSASVSAFGVSAESMQCSYDQKGNSVPTLLLLLQDRLYSQGGLQAEGIFRINAENSQEEHVRSQLNHGIVPYDIDVHCLAGLIKAWFRELPTGVLDSLSPEQVLQCNTEEQAVALVKTLPPMQAALLDWGINLMADVVQEERFNKMNARNIAMVFAPNMTQMSDPLTALMHAVQVMNLLKMLIIRTLRDREEVLLDPRPTSTCSEPPSGNGRDNPTIETAAGVFTSQITNDNRTNEEREAFLRLFDMQHSVDGYESVQENLTIRQQSKYDLEFSSDRQGSSSYVSSSLDDDSNSSSPQLLSRAEDSVLPICWNVDKVVDDFKNSPCCKSVLPNIVGSVERISFSSGGMVRYGASDHGPNTNNLKRTMCKVGAGRAETWYYGE